MAYIHENKQAGQLIRSADWNAMGHAIEQLELDKVNRAGDTITGELQVGGNTTLGAPNKGAKLQILNKQQDANGDTLMLGQAGGSNLRLGYHGNYTWVQSHGGKPLAINPLGNHVGIGTATPGEMLEVAGNLKVNGDRIRNSQGFGVIQMNAVDWLRINPDQQYPAIALFKPVAIGTGGLAVGSWEQLAQGELKVIQSAYLATGGGKVGVGSTSPAGKLEVNGTMVVSNGGNYAVVNNFMASGSLTIGSINTNFGGGSGWTTNTAGLLLETSTNTEIAVHDSGTRLTSLMYYEGDANHRVTIGRDMGWGTLGQLVIHGNVGVGTASIHNPQGWNKVLDILGTAHARLNVRSSGGVVTSVFSHDDWGGARGVIGTDSNHPLTFATNYAHRMTIDTGGSVGIGTTAPKQTLDVRGRMNVENGVIQRGGDAITNTSDLGLYSRVNANWIRIVSTAAPIRFFTDGGVGSTYALSIEANNNVVANGGLYAGNSDIYFNKTDHLHTGIGNATGNAAIENASNYDTLMILGRATADGRKVGIWDRLDINGRLFIGGREIFSDRIVSTNGTYSLVMQSDRNLVLYQPSGAVWASNTNVSDVALKDQIAPLTNPLEKVLNLRGVTFHWKDETMGKKREIGVIAQELEQVFPELVKSIDDRKFVNYEGLAPVLIEAIKEQQSLITQMKVEIRKICAFCVQRNYF